MMVRVFAAILAMVGAMAGTVEDARANETCGGIYTVKRGESLSVIADRLYKNAGMWTAIHRDNVATIGDSPNNIHVGVKLRLSCLNNLPRGLPGGTPVAALATPAPRLAIQPGTAATRQRINLLTADDYAPFTDRAAPAGGLVTEVVEAAMSSAAPDRGYAVHWVNDWSSHLDPLLSNALLDMGFPWLRPDCAGDPSQYRCENFLFSDPMFEMLVLLFTDSGRPFRFESDADIVGRTLCRPKGFYTHDLDRAGRKWLSQGLVTLRQPDSIADCFTMLAAGEVDAVALNEFTGRTAIRDLDLTGRVDVLQSRPLSIEGLHVVVHKTHPDAQAMLATINSGLRGIKADGRYQAIIDRHMSQIWAGF